MRSEAEAEVVAAAAVLSPEGGAVLDIISPLHGSTVGTAVRKAAAAVMVSASAAQSTTTNSASVPKRIYALRDQHSRSLQTPSQEELFSVLCRQNDDGIWRNRIAGDPKSQGCLPALASSRLLPLMTRIHRIAGMNHPGECEEGTSNLHKN